MVRLIHDNQLILEKIEELTEEELREILDRCGINITEGSTKVCIMCARSEIIQDHLRFLASVSGLNTLL